MIFFKHIYRAPHVQCCLMNKAPSNIVNLKNELYIYNNGSIRASISGRKSIIHRYAGQFFLQ